MTTILIIEKKATGLEKKLPLHTHLRETPRSVRLHRTQKTYNDNASALKSNVFTSGKFSDTKLKIFLLVHALHASI